MTNSNRNRLCKIKRKVTDDSENVLKLEGITQRSFLIDAREKPTLKNTESTKKFRKIMYNWQREDESQQSSRTKTGL